MSNNYDKIFKDTSDKEGKYVTKADINNLLNDNHIYTRKQIYGSDFSFDSYRKNTVPLFNETWRFGLFNPYGTVTSAREFLFFTKPDLNIIQRDERDGGTGKIIGGNGNYILAPGLNSEFWYELLKTKKRIISLLQSSFNPYSDEPNDPFNHLLQNMVNSNLEVPSLSASTVETSTNMYGVGFTYRGSSEESDDSQDFSLEFKDDRWLDVYTYFRAYEEYETEKHHGTVRPYKPYIVSRVLHDQIAIYKFIVAEDMETILYYGKYYGVMPLSLPRDIFNSENFEQGLSFSINFKSAFFEDLRPEILSDFNTLAGWNSQWNVDYENQNVKNGHFPIYNSATERVDGSPAKVAFVYLDKTSPIAKQSPNGFVYKLAWRNRF